MDMDFRWMSRPYEEKALTDALAEQQLADRLAYIKQEDDRRDRQLRNRNADEAYDAYLGALDYAQRMADRKYGTKEINQPKMFPNMSQAYNDVQAEKMAQEAQKVADMKRMKELEAELNNERSAKLAKIKDNPNYQMAAMLAMAGQPGALQGLITSAAQKENEPSQVQAKMDELEKQIANDVFALSSAKPADRRKIQEMLRTMYGDMFYELEEKGARSRMGGWAGWLAQLGAQQKTIDEANERASARAKTDEGLGQLW